MVRDLLSVFSLRRIKKPARGILTLHPLVDVLEGRNFLSGSMHEGVLTIEAGDSSAAAGSHANTVQASPAPIDEYPLHAGSDAAVVSLPPAAIPRFSRHTIGDNTETLFGNLFHDRRGHAEVRSLPAPARLSIAPQANPPATFASGRPLTGAMRPYLVMSVLASEMPFAA